MADRGGDGCNTFKNSVKLTVMTFCQHAKTDRGVSAHVLNTQGKTEDLSPKITPSAT